VRCFQRPVAGDVWAAVAGQAVHERLLPPLPSYNRDSGAQTAVHRSFASTGLHNWAEAASNAVLRGLALFQDIHPGIALQDVVLEN
jgi:hypothetical protein